MFSVFTVRLFLGVVRSTRRRVGDACTSASIFLLRARFGIGWSSLARTFAERVCSREWTLAVLASLVRPRIARGTRASTSLFWLEHALTLELPGAIIYRDTGYPIARLLARTGRVTARSC